MPNYCGNTLTVSGNKDAIKRFKEQAIDNSDKENGPSPLSFGRFVPEPEGLMDNNLNSPMPDWYTWRVSNWGTKWEVCDASVIEESDEHITYSFDTAWSPPENWLHKVAEMYKDLHFKLVYREDGMAFMGAIDFGGGSLTSAGGWDVYVAKLEGQDGTRLWSKRFGGSGSIANDRGEDIAVDVNGDVVLTGYYYGGGAADFGGGPLTGYGVDDIFVAKYSGVDGSHLWSKGVGGSSYDHANSIALDDNGDVLVTGDFQLTANFGGAPLTSSGTMDIFVAKYNGTDGSHLWSKRFGGSSDDKGRDVVAANGNVFVTGDFWNTVDFGYGPLTSAGSTDIFLLKIVP